MTTILKDIPAIVLLAIELFAAPQEQPNFIHLVMIRDAINIEGQWQFCQKRNLLIKGSAEEFAIAFMTYYNTFEYYY